MFINERYTGESGNLWGRSFDFTIFTLFSFKISFIAVLILNNNNNNDNNSNNNSNNNNNNIELVFSSVSLETTTDTVQKKVSVDRT